MKLSHSAKNALLCAALTVPLPALAASGQIDSFGASTTTVTVGAQVDFTGAFGLSTSAWSDGGSNLTEPPPQEGYQSWHLNWYHYEYETLSEVRLEAGGLSFTDFPGVPAGSSHAGSWSFSILFPSAGNFDVTLNGGWSANVETYTSNESAWRECSNSDPGGSDLLTCSAWTYEYLDLSDNYSVTGSFNPLALSITVQQAVPEPQTLGLWLAGLAGLMTAQRRRRQDHGRVSHFPTSEYRLSAQGVQGFPAVVSAPPARNCPQQFLR